MKPGQPDLPSYLAYAETVILSPSASAAAPVLQAPAKGELRVGADLGTAYLVLVVLDEGGQPLAGEYQFAQVVRDGLVVDFIGAADRLAAMKKRLERRLGRPLTHAASGYPPGVPQAEVRSTGHVLETAGFVCSGLIDEPSAANAVLGIRRGAIVDVGGGTTGIAIIEDGQVVYTADEPTGGTHFSLVIAGALNISLEQAEALKTDPQEQPRLFSTVLPVMEKVGNIISRHIAGRSVDQLFLVGGASAFMRMPEVIQDYTGVPTRAPERPLFVTPLGIALHDVW